MRCNEARKRLRAVGSGQPLEHDEELRLHLAGCPSCAAEAQVRGLLQRVFDAASEDDRAAVLPLAAQRERIETLAAQRDRRPRRAYRIRLRYIVAFGLAVALILLVAVVPFSYQNILGYRLALNGVGTDLASDSDAVCDLLAEIGLQEANVDLMGCDTTCHIMIVDLHTPEEAQMVVDAVAHRCRCRLQSDVIAVGDRRSATLLDHAQQGTLRRLIGG